MAREAMGWCEQQIPETTQKADLKLSSGVVKTLVCSATETELVFEGDIIVSPRREKLGVIIVGQLYRWPDGVVVYEIDPALPDQERVTRAIAHWEGRTSIRFRPRNKEKDYVIFRPGGGCSSSVGRAGGVQFVTLGAGCSTGNAIHEIGHTVGLWHEQSREDREDHITLDWTNIEPLYSHNFDQHITDGDDVGGYDFGSIMHYPANAFAIDPGKPTIVPKVTGVYIGQRERLSDGDVAAVAAMYPGTPAQS